MLAVASGLVVCFDGVLAADARTAAAVEDAELSVDVLESVLAERVVFLAAGVVVPWVLPPRCDC